MKSKMKVVLALCMAVCFVLAVSAPMVFAAGTTPAKKASTTHHATAHKTHKITPNAEVKAAQEALIKDGAKIKADGIMGKHTRSAIRAFQKKNGLKVTGKLDKVTLAKLQ